MLMVDPRSVSYTTSDAADDLLCVDLGGRRIIKKKTNTTVSHTHFSLHPNTLLHI